LKQKWRALLEHAIGILRKSLFFNFY
jgi:hypothetical protein